MKHMHIKLLDASTRNPKYRSWYSSPTFHTPSASCSIRCPLGLAYVLGLLLGYILLFFLSALKRSMAFRIFHSVFFRMFTLRYYCPRKEGSRMPVKISVCLNSKYRLSSHSNLLLLSQEAHNRVSHKKSVAY